MFPVSGGDAVVPLSGVAAGVPVLLHLRGRLEHRLHLLRNGQFSLPLGEELDTWGALIGRVVGGGGRGSGAS